jgi:hypothetical protein
MRKVRIATSSLIVLGVVGLASQYFTHGKERIDADSAASAQGIHNQSVDSSSWDDDPSVEEVEALSLAVREIPARPVPTEYASRNDVKAFISRLSPRLSTQVPDAEERESLLATLHYEAIRAGLDPLLALGIIEHSSGFRPYAVSEKDARGYMQVMPFWTEMTGHSEHNLFHLRTNLRYGCALLRAYFDAEKGDLYRALRRYGRQSGGGVNYPSSVAAAMRRLDGSTSVRATEWNVTPSVEEQLVQIARATQKNMPMELPGGLVAVQAAAIGKTLAFRYNIVRRVDSPERLKALTYESSVNTACSTPETVEALKAGVSMKYDFYFADSRYAFGYVFDRRACKS